MLNRFYYFNERYDCPAEKIAAGIPVAHIVDPHQPEAWHRLLDHQYSKDGNYPFCLALKHPASATPDKLKELLLFFFHPFYERAGGGKPLFIYGRPQDRNIAGLRLEEIFRAQNLEVELIFVDEASSACGSPGRSGTAKWLTGHQQNAADDYYRYCLTSYDPEDIFMVDGLSGAGLMADLHGILADLEAQHPLLCRLAKANIGLRKELVHLTEARASLEEEKKILQELLELSNRHDEVSYILRFYRNEYEVLPLWYKRAGHILKVIMGKRSFKSLYDKTEKKYKD